MTLSDLKIYFRTLIKPVPGGPPVGTVGSNRTVGVLAALDKLADETQPNALLDKIDVAASAAAGVQVSVVAGLLVFAVATAVANQAPSVTINGDATGTVGTQQRFQATASDSDGTVAKVELCLMANATDLTNFTVLDMDVFAPYDQLKWTPSSAGNFTLRMRATDDKGATSFSSGLAVQVAAAMTSPLVVSPATADYADNARTQAVAGYTWRNPFAKLRAQAQAAGTAYIKAVGHGQPALVEVLKNGAHFALLIGTQLDTAETLAFAPDGAGVYTLVEGAQGRAYEQGDVSFTSIQEYGFDAAAGASKLAVSRRGKLLIVRGDSVTQGATSANPLLNSWTQQVEKLLPTHDVLVLGYGGKQGYLDMQTATTQAALLASVAPICQLYSEVVWWDGCGINDYAFGSVSAPTWASATLTGLTYLKNNIANLTRIYWQSPTPITNGTGAGPGGSVFSDFQVTVQNATTNAPTWLRLVDGNNIGVSYPAVTGTAVGQLFDNAHPNDLTYGAMSQANYNILTGVTATVRTHNILSSAVTLSGQWNFPSPNPNGVGYTVDAQGYYTVTDTCVKFEIYGTRQDNTQEIVISIDGGTPFTVNTYANSQDGVVRLLYQSPTLTSGSHSVKVGIGTSSALVYYYLKFYSL